MEFTNRFCKKRRTAKKPSLFDQTCSTNGIGHRLTKPCTPKTNGMVERANGIVKTNTIYARKYSDADEMSRDLTIFLIYYNLSRRHGSLCRELGVKTPFDALQKWQKLKPCIFIRAPQTLKTALLALKTADKEKN